MSGMLRALEPYLKRVTFEVLSPWKGNLVLKGDLRKAIVPWGFVSQQKIREWVSPARSEVEIEHRASRLLIDEEEFLQGTVEAYRHITSLFAPPRSQDGLEYDQGQLTGERSTDFLELEVASPHLSLFLNDVLHSYRKRGLIPRLKLTDVEARLCKIGVRLGGVAKNSHFLGLMGKDEAHYHLAMGMVGPEGVLINEMEGRAPQKVIADVELRCREEFVLEDDTGKEVHRSCGDGFEVHFLTLQSDVMGVDDGYELEWQVTNINDVIEPNLDYYFSRFGH